MASPPRPNDFGVVDWGVVARLSVEFHRLGLSSLPSMHPSPGEGNISSVETARNSPHLSFKKHFSISISM